MVLHKEYARTVGERPGLDLHCGMAERAACAEQGKGEELRHRLYPRRLVI
jgi:hypothetical protein